MQVIVYSASRKGSLSYGTIGDRRWECEWHALTKDAEKRFWADSNYEHDHDMDEICRVTIHKTKDAAIAAGTRVAVGSVYGCAIVQEHILDWFVEEDRVGEWEPVGPQFEVDALGEVAEI